MIFRIEVRSVDTSLIGTVSIIVWGANLVCLVSDVSSSEWNLVQPVDTWVAPRTAPHSQVPTGVYGTLPSGGVPFHVYESSIICPRQESNRIYCSFQLYFGGICSEWVWYFQVSRGHRREHENEAFGSEVTAHAQNSDQSVQSLSGIRLFATPWTAAHEASLSITNSWSLLKLMSIESVMPSNHLIICCPLLPPSIFPSIRIFSNESEHQVAKYWSFSFNISPSNEHWGLICFRMDWLDLLAVQGTL